MNPCPRCCGGFPDDPDLPVCQCGSDWPSPRKDNPVSETAKWLKSREGWLRVIAVPAPSGGFEIAVVIDGSYALEAGPRRIARGHAERIAAALRADGAGLARALPVDVRPQLPEHSAPDRRTAEERERLRNQAVQASKLRDLGGMFANLDQAYGMNLDESDRLYIAFDEDGDDR